MVRCRAVVAKREQESGDKVYTFEQLPEDREKRYASLLEDFDKQITAHIEESNATMKNQMIQMRNTYRVALFQLAKQQRDLLQEEVVLSNNQKKEPAPSVRECTIFSTELAKVSEKVASTITSQVTKVENRQRKEDEGIAL